GLYREHLISVTKKGKKGADEIREMMEMFRNNTPKSICNIDVQEIRDFKTQTISAIADRTTRPTGLVSSNVLQLQLKDKTLITMRPSGTEPKIKFYFSTHHPWNPSTESWETADQNLRNKIQQIINEMELH
ncbi:MAG: phospho-sugar mutase, partial [Bacteroidales bacterium]